MSNIKNKLVNGAIRLSILVCLAWVWYWDHCNHGLETLYHRATVPGRGYFYLIGDSYYLRHEINGIKYKNTFASMTWRWIDTKYNPGDSLNIKYNPENPSKFYPSDAPDAYGLITRDYWESKLLFVFFGGIFMFYAIAVPYPWHLRKRFKEWLDNL